MIVKNAAIALKGTKQVDLDGYHHGPARHPKVKPFIIEGASISIEASSKRDGFKKISAPRASEYQVYSNLPTNNDPVATLTDGKLSDIFGPIFGNGIHNGAYKMDLGTVKEVSAITSWSANKKNVRGAQKLVIYASRSETDPGWDLSKYTVLGTIDTGKAKEAFVAASLRASAKQSLGSYRWIVWAVSPVTTAGGGENTAFQEFSVETVK